jgi:hypothetical protein
MKKALVCPAVFIVFVIFFICSIEDAFSLKAVSKSKEPEEYIIQKGDTLWDISDEKLEDTFLWPKLWNVNPDIDNPDFIYPGSTIIIPSREELMKMPFKPLKKKSMKKKRKKPKVTYKFVMPEDVKQKYIVDKDLYMQTGWIGAELIGIGEVTYSPFDRQIVGKHDIVYLKLTEGKTLAASTLSSNPLLLVNDKKGDNQDKKLLTSRIIKEVKHPVTGKTLGQQIRITGILEIIGEDNNIPKAKIIRSFEEVSIGDILLPFSEMEPPLLPDTSRTPGITGYIVETRSNSSIAGKGNVIFLGKGQDDGLEIGDTFSAFSDSPAERLIGKIQVFALQPNTSAALVLNSSQELFIGTKWGNK